MAMAIGKDAMVGGLLGIMVVFVFVHISLKLFEDL
jgi:hypothetical protein